MSTAQPTADTFSRKCAALLNANADLIGDIVKNLHKGTQKDLEALLAAGGSVGLEYTVNRNGTNRICLVGVEQEGSRRVLATIAQPEPHGHARR